MKNKYKAFAITCLTLFGITLLSGCTKDDISDLKEEVSNLQSQINDLQSQISTLQNQMKNEIQSVKDEYNPQIETLKNQISSLNEELTALKTSLEKAKKELQENLNKNIHELRTHIDEEVSKLQNQITQNENELSSLKTKHDQDVLTLKSDYEKKISSLQEDVDKKKAELEKDYNDKLGALETTYNTKVQSIQNDIDACNASIASFKETYKQEKQSLEDDYNNKINALKEEYQNKVSSIESSISSLEDGISTLKEEMNALIANIQKDYNDKIDDLVTRVGKLENVTYYTITFDSNGGEGTFTSQKIAKGDAITKPADPRKDGYDFDGWYTSLDEKWPFSGNVVTRDMTLTARYLPHTYTIHIDFGDGTYNEKNSYTLFTPYLSDYTLPTPTYYGHRFAGYVDQNKKTIPLTGNYSFIEDLELSTNWDPLYVLTLDSDGGTSYEPIAKYDYNPIESLPTPTKDGATFQGWYLGETKIEFPYTPTSFESFTLKAKWRYASDTFTYEFFNNDEEVKITGYLAKEANVEIPETISNKPVTLIGAQAFQNNKNIESIELSSSINELEAGCLLGCDSLKEIAVSQINYPLLEAFNYEENNVPKTLIKIKFANDFVSSDKLFAGIQKKKFQIKIGMNVSKFCFKDNKLIEGVIFEHGWSFQEIPDRAFYGCCNLNRAAVPDTVKIIGYGAFMNTKISDFRFPTHLKRIESNAFYGVLSVANLPSEVEFIGGGALSNVSFITIPKNVKEIGYEAISNWVQRIDYEGTKADWFKISNDRSSYLLDKVIFKSTQFATFKNKNGLEYYEMSGGDVYLRTCKNDDLHSVDFNDEYFKKLKIVDYPKKEPDVINEAAYFHGLEAVRTPSYMSVIKEDFIDSVCNSTLYLVLSEGTIEIENVVGSGIKTLEIPTSVKKIGRLNSAIFEIRYLGSEEQWKEVEKEYISDDIHISFDCSPTISFDEQDGFLFALCQDGTANIIKNFNQSISELSFEEILIGYKNLAIMPCAFFDSDAPINIKKIIFDSRVIYIGNRSFYGFKNGLLIPKTVLFLSAASFFGYESLPTIYCEQTSPSSDWQEDEKCSFADYNWCWYSETLNTDGQHWHYVDGKPTIWTK